MSHTSLGLTICEVAGIQLQGMSGIFLPWELCIA